MFWVRFWERVKSQGSAGWAALKALKQVLSAKFVRCQKGSVQKRREKELRYGVQTWVLSIIVVNAYLALWGKICGVSEERFCIAVLSEVHSCSHMYRIDSRKLVFECFVSFYDSN